MRSAEHVPIIWNRAAKQAGKCKDLTAACLLTADLKKDSSFPFREFVEKVQDKILAPGKRTEICGDCQWGSICDQVKSRWE